jgi:hypothetical protein
MLRFILDIILLFFVFLLPTWLTALLVLVCIFYFDFFAEAIFFGLIMDIIYGGGKVFGMNFPYIFTVVLGLIFLISLKLRGMLKFYSSKRF